MIDPWGSGEIKDYDKIMKEFGIKPFKPLVKNIPDPHLLMRRGIIFGHRDFEKILECIKTKKEFCVMTGLMPSGDFHLGHALLVQQIIYYQGLGARIFLCVADIEAYNMRRIGLEKLREIAIEEYLVNRTQKELGSDLQVSIEYYKNLPRESSGKLKDFVSYKRD